MRTLGRVRGTLVSVISLLEEIVTDLPDKTIPRLNVPQVELETLVMIAYNAAGLAHVAKDALDAEINDFVPLADYELLNGRYILAEQKAQDLMDEMQYYRTSAKDLERRLRDVREIRDKEQKESLRLRDAERDLMRLRRAVLDDTVRWGIGIGFSPFYNPPAPSEFTFPTVQMVKEMRDAGGRIEINGLETYRIGLKTAKDAVDHLREYGYTIITDPQASFTTREGAEEAARKLDIAFLSNERIRELQRFNGVPDISFASVSAWPIGVSI